MAAVRGDEPWLPLLTRSNPELRSNDLARVVIAEGAPCCC